MSRVAQALERLAAEHTSAPMPPPPASSTSSVPGIEARIDSPSVARVLAAGFSRTWVEAAALAQAVAMALPKDACVPAPEHILIDANGKIVFTSRNDSGEAPAVSLTVLLAWLLDGAGAPYALRRLATFTATGVPACRSADDLVAQLEAFVRGDGERIVRSIAERLPHPDRGTLPLYRRVAQRLRRSLRPRDIDRHPR